MLHLETSMNAVFFSNFIAFTLDQKPVVVEGKRQRTAVQAFTSAAPAKEKKGLEFEVGRGTLLGEIEIGLAAFFLTF